MACLTPVMQQTRTVALPHFFVARTHAMQERYRFRGFAVGGADASFLEHPFDIDRRKNVVVDAVAILFLDLGRENIIARSHDYRIAVDFRTVGERYAFPRVVDATDCR